MKTEVEKYLFDIREACLLLKEFTDGKTLDDYLSNTMLRSAVERQFEIIGEALNHALQHQPSLEEDITHARRIIGFRNRLIHGYSSVSDKVVWGVVEGSLPTLWSEISSLLFNNDIS